MDFCQSEAVCNVLQTTAKFFVKTYGAGNVNRGSSSDHGRRLRLFNGDALWRGKHENLDSSKDRFGRGMPIAHYLEAC